LKTLDKTDDELKELRQQLRYLMSELAKWGVRYYRNDRNIIMKEIKYSYNKKRLEDLRDHLENKLNKIVMGKLSQNL
jgi:transposase